MEGIGTREYAQYPFLSGAGEYIASSGFSIEHFGNDEDLVPYVNRALERITAAANGLVYSSELDKGDTDPKTLDREVFSFLIAIILLKVSGANSLVKRFALAESRRAEKFIEKSLKNDASIALKILHTMYSNVTHDKISGEYLIPISDYVSHSVRFHEREWKLVNRIVDGGKVRLTKHQTVRLIRHDLANYIGARISDAQTPEMMPNFEKPVQKIREMAKKLEPEYEIVSGENPPCIKHALKVLENGENLPHSGRFMLAAFLLGRGQKPEEIAPLFKTAPDYNERVTTYQIRNISGKDGGTKYSCPLCDKLRTQDLCYMTDECDGIISPMQFGTRRR